MDGVREITGLRIIQSQDGFPDGRWAEHRRHSRLPLEQWRMEPFGSSSKNIGVHWAAAIKLVDIRICDLWRSDGGQSCLGQNRDELNSIDDIPKHLYPTLFGLRRLVILRALRAGCGIHSMRWTADGEKQLVAWRILILRVAAEMFSSGALIGNLDIRRLSSMTCYLQ